MMWDSNNEVTEREDRYSVGVLELDCQPAAAKNPKLPRNSYLVTYMTNGVVHYDIVMGLRSNIFDCYYDKLGQGAIRGIVWTDGKVVTKLFNKKEYLKEHRGTTET